ncbi:MAG TPA: Trm112 family protein [Pilimelia sp.]|nr:Trm112 family protein [Pilimelia sp.]
MSLDPQLVEILACPDTHHTALEYDAGEETLTCPECGRVFEVRDGIPVLLLDEARPVRKGP